LRLHWTRINFFPFQKTDFLDLGIQMHALTYSIVWPKINQSIHYTNKNGEAKLHHSLQTNL